MWTTLGYLSLADATGKPVHWHLCHCKLEFYAMHWTVITHSGGDIRLRLPRNGGDSTDLNDALVVFKIVPWDKAEEAEAYDGKHNIVNEVFEANAEHSTPHRQLHQH